MTDPKTGHNAPVSRLAVIVGIIAIAMLGLAAVLFVGEGSESAQRLALVFGVIGSAMAALVSALRADQAASSLNGGMDDRIRRAVFEAQAVRRSSDVDGLGRIDRGGTGVAGEAGPELVARPRVVEDDDGTAG